MIRRFIQRVLDYFGYRIYKIPSPSKTNTSALAKKLPPVNPIWPLPRRAGGLSADEIRREFAKYELWLYAFEFEGGISLPASHRVEYHSDYPEATLQRFRHLMPHVLQSQNGSLRGKRVLDIACNSGFWSVQCALLGAEVVGFDARAEVIEQANLIKSIVGVNNVEFSVLDFWKMSPESLGGQFDMVLFIGSLQVLPNPLRALELARAMTQQWILLDTMVHPANDTVVELSWGEEPVDIRQASRAGIVARPSKSSVELMLRHIGVTGWSEIPPGDSPMSLSYREHRRASWLIKV
jgi:hypothetical protein